MNKDTKQLTITAFFVAIIILLGVTQLGIVSIPPANATIMHIPVIIGTLLPDKDGKPSLKRGLILGFAFGLTSVYKLFVATSVLMAPLLAVNAAIPIFISIAARMMIPVVAYLVYKCFKKNEKIGCGVASAAGTVTNTVCYLGLMLLAYIFCKMDSTALLSTIAGVAVVNGLAEAALAVLICTPIIIVLKKYLVKESR